MKNLILGSVAALALGASAATVAVAQERAPAHFAYWVEGYAPPAEFYASRPEKARAVHARAVSRASAVRVARANRVAPQVLAQK